MEVAASSGHKATITPEIRGDMNQFPSPCQVGYAGDAIPEGLPNYSALRSLIPSYSIPPLVRQFDAVRGVIWSVII